MIFTFFDGKIVKKGPDSAILYNSALWTVPRSVDSANIIEIQQF